MLESDEARLPCTFMSTRRTAGDWLVGDSDTPIVRPLGDSRPSRDDSGEAEVVGSLHHEATSAPRFPLLPRAASGEASASDVLISLVRSDLRARYGRGTSQFAKWLLDPFAAVGVYLLLVTIVLHRPGRAPGLSVACAVIPFQL